MSKILLILVGGTICTALNEKGTLSVNEKAGLALIENFKNSDSPFKNEVEITPTENLFILSENMTIEKWNLMIKTYKEYMAKDKFDGVIFAHGTDTLAYSASVFSLLLADSSVPVFFVSANARLDSSSSNGNYNFRFAAECIHKGIEPNVYVPYKNISDGRMKLHLASRLEQCPNYSDDFSSFGAIDMPGFTEEDYCALFQNVNALLKDKSRKKAEKPSGIVTLKNCVLKITPYVGIDYSVYNFKPFSAVLHGSFHSGTACALSESEYGSILKMQDMCAEENTDTYFSPSMCEGEIYDTVRIIAEHRKDDKKIHFLYGYTNEMAYAKLVMAYSLFDDKDEIKSYILTEQNYERIDR